MRLYLSNGLDAQLYPFRILFFLLFVLYEQCLLGCVLRSWYKVFDY